MNAYVLVQTDGNTDLIAPRLQALPGVVFAEDVKGTYDALALARSNQDGLALDAIVAAIRKLPGVIRALAAPLIGSPREARGGEAA